jgi:Squalene-hopene cyclase N-terminal domain
MTIFTGLFLSLAIGGEQKSDSAPTTVQVRRAVEQSLAFLEKEGVAWMEAKKCTSCHHVPLMLRSFDEARQRGFQVEQAKLDKWRDWSWTYTLSQQNWFNLMDLEFQDAEKVLPGVVAGKLKPLVGKSFTTEGAFLEALAKVLSADEVALHQAKLTELYSRPRIMGGPSVGGGFSTMCQLLLARDPVGDAKDVKTLEAVANMVFKIQEYEGGWGPTATKLDNSKRAHQESVAVHEMWGALAVASLEKIIPRSVQSRQRFLRSSKDMPVGDSNESLVLHMLIEQQFGDAERAKALLQELSRRQNPDGGWSWLKGQGSDAFATGQSLYGLGTMDIRADDPRVQRAAKFLLTSQGKDGSWQVPLGNITKKNPSRSDTKAIYQYWGSAWATIGLTRILPKVEQ